MENTSNRKYMSNYSEFDSSSSSIGSSWISWPDSDDNGIGTSINPDSTTEFSNPENLEHEIRHIQDLKNQLAILKSRRSLILKTVKTKDQQYNSARLEAERELLLTELKSQVLLCEFRKKSEASTWNNFCNIGSITISNLKLHHGALPNKNSHYFLCVLTSGFKLFFSQIAEVDFDGFVNFNINHTFLNLPVDFEINIRIYVLTIKKASTNKLRFLCYDRKNNRKNYDQDWYRESQFVFWREISVRISHINEPQEFILDLVQSEVCKLFVDVACTIIGDPRLLYTGWLDISRNNGLFWNQRWCVLQGLQLKYFNHPVEDTYAQPINILDLRLCSLVRTTTKSESTIRSKSLILEIRQNETVARYYLSCDSNNELDSWNNYLQSLVSTIEIWTKHGK